MSTSNSFIYYFRPGTIHIEIERSRKRPACEDEEKEFEETHSAAKKRRRDEKVIIDYEESEIRYYDAETKKEDSREVVVVGSKRSESEPDEALRRISEPEKGPKRVSAFRRLGNDSKVKHAVKKWLGDGRAVQRKTKARQKRAYKDKSSDVRRALLGLLHILAVFNK